MRYKQKLAQWARRRNKIRVEAHRGINQSEIARKLRITKQRVSQIINGK